MRRSRRAARTAPLDPDRILDGLMEHPAGLLLYLGQPLDVGEAPTTLKAFAARRTANLGMVLGRLKCEPTGGARSFHRHWRDMVGAETFVTP